jgi:hypothetical protein
MLHVDCQILWEYDYDKIYIVELAELNNTIRNFCERYSDKGANSNKVISAVLGANYLRRNAQRMGRTPLASGFQSVTGLSQMH